MSGTASSSAGLIQIAEAEVVEQRASATASLDFTPRDDDAIVGVVLHLRLARDHAVDQPIGVRRVLLRRIEHRAAAVRAAGRDDERVRAREAGIPLAEFEQREADRLQDVLAPLRLWVLFRVRGLERDAMRTFRQEGLARRIVEIGVEMRVAARLLRRRLPPVEQVDAVGLEDVEAVAVALVGVDDGAAAAQAPKAEVDDIAKQARGSIHRHGDEAASLAREIARDLQQHRDALAALSVIGIGEIFLAGDLAAIRQERPRRFIDIRAEQASETLPAAAVKEQRGAPKLRRGRMQRIGVAGRGAEHRLSPEAPGHEVVGHAVVGRVRADAQPRRRELRGGNGAASAAGQQRGDQEFLHGAPRSLRGWGGGLPVWDFEFEQQRAQAFSVRV